MGPGYLLQPSFAAKNHKNANNLTTILAREKESTILESSELKRILMYVWLKLRNNQILHHKIVHRIIGKTKLFSG